MHMRNPAGFFAAAFQFPNWHTSCQIGVNFVYDGIMKFTDQFSLVLDSQEHAMLEEMASFCAQFDFTEHNDPEIFERVWDKILDAHLEIVDQDDRAKS